MEKTKRYFEQSCCCSHRKTKNCERKRIVIDSEKIRRILLSKRTTIRSLACATKVSKSALRRYVQTSDDLRRHTNPIKPFLKESNKKSRVQFCLSMIDKIMMAMILDLLACTM